MTNKEPTSLWSAIQEGNTGIKVVKAAIFLTIIFGALFGNILVVIAVTRFRRLRNVRTNMFLVSLAFADFLVAIVVMPFNALQSLSNGYWPFNHYMCHIFNSNDVLFSTASILHLCGISVDRYVAVFKPLQYEFIMTRKRIALMLISLWTASFMISYIPIWTEIYTTDNALKNYDKTKCHFIVNPIYAIVSSSVSFWIPCIVMTTMYVRIYQEAKRQNLKIKSLTPKEVKPNNKTYKPVDKQSENDYLQVNNQPNFGNIQLQNNVSDIEKYKNRKRRPIYNKVNENLSFPELQNKSNNFNKLKNLSKENKAAKTLGIIMGAFIACLLPFFSWYTITNICSWFTKCQKYPLLGNILFWIGYFNSTLNPLIYVFFNKEFRFAFCKLLGCNLLTAKHNQNGNSFGAKSSLILIDEQATAVRSTRSNNNLRHSHVSSNLSADLK